MPVTAANSAGAIRTTIVQCSATGSGSDGVPAFLQTSANDRVRVCLLVVVPGPVRVTSPRSFRPRWLRRSRRLAGLGDSQVVVRAVNDFFAQLDFELEAVADVRQDAVRQLRQQGWTLERIAEATGLSVSRVGQISRRGGMGRHVRRLAILRD